MQKLELEGQRFGKLTVLSPSGRQNKGHHVETLWLCKCDCGEETLKLGYVLRRKTRPARSCGCLKHIKRPKHGMSFSREYRSWRAMKERCFNRKNHNYSNYGARGITVCDAWLLDFKQFYKDMGPRPKGKTLGRINNDLGYFPENCEWQTYYQQTHNRRPYRGATC